MVKDIEKDFGSMNEVWNEWIDPNNKPVRATTQASLATQKLLVEMFSALKHRISIQSDCNWEAYTISLYQYTN